MQHLSPPIDPKRLGWMLSCVALLLAGWLVNGFLQHAWLIDGAGRIIANDFVNVWAAGAMAWEGRADQAYIWLLHRMVEVQAIGHDFDGYYGWHYPPPFLFVAQLLALAPYLAAWALWMLVSGALYLYSMHKIIGHWLAVPLALAFPAAIWNLSVGQNGFLTAALVGGAVLCLPRRPLLAGLWIGLLAYKPQFGIVFPLILLLELRWQAFIAASSVVVAMVVTSAAIHGIASWQAFVDWMPMTAHKVLQHGDAGFHKLHSAFGLLRWLGWPAQNAMLMHGACALAMFGAVVWIRRSRAPEEMKAAALAMAVLFASPYLYIYDLVIAAIPLAFFVRMGLRDGFLAYEAVGLIAAGFCVLIFPLTGVPAGFASLLLMAVLLVRRQAWYLRAAP